MESTEKMITLFSTRVRQMILQYKEQVKENQRLSAELEARDAKIKQMEARVGQLQMDYDALKTARMIEFSDGDMENAKKRLAKLIRDVNKCITLLSEK